MMRFHASLLSALLLAIVVSKYGWEAKCDEWAQRRKLRRVNRQPETEIKYRRVKSSKSTKKKSKNYGSHDDEPQPTKRPTRMSTPGLAATEFRSVSNSESRSESSSNSDSHSYKSSKKHNSKEHKSSKNRKSNLLSTRDPTKQPTTTPTTTIASMQTTLPLMTTAHNKRDG